MFEQVVLVKWGGDGVAVETFISEKPITQSRVVEWLEAHYVGFAARRSDAVEFIDPSDFRDLDADSDDAERQNFNDDPNEWE